MSVSFREVIKDSHAGGCTWRIIPGLVSGKYPWLRSPLSRHINYIYKKPQIHQMELGVPQIFQVDQPPLKCVLSLPRLPSGGALWSPGTSATQRWRNGHVCWRGEAPSPGTLLWLSCQVLRTGRTRNFIHSIHCELFFLLFFNYDSWSFCKARL